MMKGVESSDLSRRYGDKWSKSAQQARKGCSSLLPDAGETSDTGSRGSGVPWSEYGKSNYPDILKKSPDKRNCQRQWSVDFLDSFPVLFSRLHGLA